MSEAVHLRRTEETSPFSPDDAREEEHSQLSGIYDETKPLSHSQEKVAVRLQRGDVHFGD